MGNPNSKVEGNIMGIKNIEIARILNISPAAVSLARNNKKGVSEETRANVQKIVSDYMEVHPNESTSISSEKELVFVVHKTHGQVIKDTPFFSEMMETIQKMSPIDTYKVSVINLSNQGDVPQLLSLCRASSVHGILLLASEMNENDFQIYKQIGKPVVVIDAHFPNEHVDCVGIDNEFLVRQGVKYAYNMGHRRIGFLASRFFTFNFEERLKAYQQTMSSLGLPVSEEDIIYLHCVADFAYEDMRRHLINSKKESLHSCYIAGNDLLAIGAIKALKEAGIRVPEDISVIGFDDMPIISMMEPPLSSLHFCTRDICELAVSRLMQIIKRGSCSCCRLDVKGELVSRNSVIRKHQ